MTIPLCSSGFPVTEIAGYRAHTRARSTGTLVVLVDAGEFGISAEDGGRWMLLCEPHSCNVQFEVQADARSFLSYPEEWCQDCQTNTA